MAEVSEQVTVETVRDYIVSRGGVVKNADLVNRFRSFLQQEDPEKKAQARTLFKDYVNAIAVLESQNGEKYLVLKQHTHTQQKVDIRSSRQPQSFSPIKITDSLEERKSTFENHSRRAGTTPERREKVPHWFQSREHSCSNSNLAVVGTEGANNEWDDASSIGTSASAVEYEGLDPTEHEWIKSTHGDVDIIHRPLKVDPSLVNRKKKLAANEVEINQVVTQLRIKQKANEMLRRRVELLLKELSKEQEYQNNLEIENEKLKNENEQLRKSSKIVDFDSNNVTITSKILKSGSYYVAYEAQYCGKQSIILEDICPEVSLKSKKCRASIPMLLAEQLKLQTTLNVSGHSISDQGADMIATVLLETVSLKKLGLSNVVLNTAKATKIASALKNISSLKVFSINNNDIDDGAVDNITAVFRSNPLIENINLSHNKLSYTGVLNIVNSLLRNIKIFDISNNFITSDSVLELATALSKCPVLQELNISQNRLTLTDVLTIAQALRCHPTLQTLDLSNNNISFPSACEFIVDLVLSINQKLVNLNVCGRNIRPRYVEGYLSPPRSENDSNKFALQSLYLLQHSSLCTMDTRTSLIKVKETCPIFSEDVMSYYADHLGGVFYNQYHNFVIVVPPGAVSQGDCVEIQATANCFGPYIIPDRFYPISSYFWVSANYEFEVPVYLIMNHYAKIRDLEDNKNLHVLHKCVKDPDAMQDDLRMSTISDGVYFDIEIGYCVLATYHFCSYCQAKSIKNIPEYLLACYCTYEHEPSSGSFIAEVSFCPSNFECKKVIIEQCEKRNTKLQHTEMFVVADGDMFYISSDFSNVNKDDWILMQRGKLTITHLCDFEYWKMFSGLSVEQIKEREESCDYPPRLQIKCKQINISKSLYSSFVISKKSKNMDTSMPIAQFSLEKEVKVTSEVPVGTATSPSSITQSDKPTWKLEEKPTLKMLSRISCSLAAHWKNIACELLNLEDVKNIDSTTKNNEDKCLDMLIKWLETDTTATYSKLIDALCEHNLDAVAEQIKDKVLKL